MQADRKYIGARLRLRREYLRMTQQEVSEKLSMNRVTYAQYEQGRNEMAVSDLPRIAKVLEVSPSYFFEDGDDGEQGASVGDAPNSNPGQMNERLANIEQQLQSVLEMLRAERAG